MAFVSSAGKYPLLLRGSVASAVLSRRFIIDYGELSYGLGLALILEASSILILLRLDGSDGRSYLPIL